MKQKHQEIEKKVLEDILLLPKAPIQIIAIDGVDGVGKTTFADSIATRIKGTGRPVIRASVDNFHNPEDIRYRLGKKSPEGFFKDSYNYEKLKEVLIDPLLSGNLIYKTKIFNVQKNQAISEEAKKAKPGSILILDGIFLHRSELNHFWHYSIFLKAPFSITIPRGAQRGYGNPELSAPSNHRYIAGQKIYLKSCQPEKIASIVIDYSNLESPELIS